MSLRSDTRPVPGAFDTTVKVIVTGGFGVGKTTFVGAVSEIDPLVTEAPMTETARGIDDVTAVPDKLSTTVALDFGRIRLDAGLLLYMFGTPGQERFSFLWDDLVDGAIGAVVMLDVRRLRDSFAVLDYLEQRDIPFLLAVNDFDPLSRFDHEEIREALGVAPGIAVVGCDARSRESVKLVLAALIDHLLVRRRTRDGAGSPPLAGTR